MRIISGRFKNRSLASPKGLTTRPTPEKVREAIFNSLQNEIQQALFMDVFAGSGAMGFEALSRGAKSAVFLDKSQQAVKSIKKNIVTLGVQKQTVIYKGDVIISLDKIHEFGHRFDIIYIDPPYQQGYSEKVLVKIDDQELLRNAGLVLIEERSQSKLNEGVFRNLQFEKRRDFGDTSVFQFRLVKTSS